MNFTAKTFFKVVSEIRPRSSFMSSTPRLVVPARNVNYNAKVMKEEEEEGVEFQKPSKWLSYNDKIYPPTLPDEEQRPAVLMQHLLKRLKTSLRKQCLNYNVTDVCVQYLCHVKRNIKYSPKKLWYIACFVRGMSVEEALKQLDFVIKKGAIAVKETILEAQQLAVDKHNVEFKSNLWIAESFVGKGHVVKGIRRHARRRLGKVEYKYCHYFLRLEEGKPPANYYNLPSTDKDTLLSKWLESMRKRRVISSL